MSQVPKPQYQADTRYNQSIPHRLDPFTFATLTVLSVVILIGPYLVAAWCIYEGTRLRKLGQPDPEGRTAAGIAIVIVWTFVIVAICVWIVNLTKQTR